MIQVTSAKLLLWRTISWLVVSGGLGFMVMMIAGETVTAQATPYAPNPYVADPYADPYAIQGYYPSEATLDLDTRLRQTLSHHGVTPPQLPPEPTAAKVALGKHLFFDKILSGNRNISCATCHHPSLGTGDHLSLSIGVNGVGLGPVRQFGHSRELIPRNATEIFNRAALEWRTMFWDMRISGSPHHGFQTPAGPNLPYGLDNIMAVQAMFPVTSRDEMRGRVGDYDIFGLPNDLALVPDEEFGHIWELLMQRLLSVPEYVSLFEQAYPTLHPSQLGFEHAANAIAAFEMRAFTLLDSPFDHYLLGDNQALTTAQKRGGMLFFGRVGCGSCHSGPLLSDQRAHNIGVPQLGPGKGNAKPLDHGRAGETGNPNERYAFRTPPLRNVAITGPWMHNGAYTSLSDAVAHHFNPIAALQGYNPNQLPPPFRYEVRMSPQLTADILSTLDPLVHQEILLTDQEFGDLMSFLYALTSRKASEATHMLSLIPAGVPSGLPIQD